jgi:hypothetical protein
MQVFHLTPTLRVVSYTQEIETFIRRLTEIAIHTTSWHGNQRLPPLNLMTWPGIMLAAVLQVSPDK